MSICQHRVEVMQTSRNKIPFNCPGPYRHTTLLFKFTLNAVKRKDINIATENDFLSTERAQPFETETVTERPVMLAGQGRTRPAEFMLAGLPCDSL